MEPEWKPAPALALVSQPFTFSRDHVCFYWPPGDVPAPPSLALSARQADARSLMKQTPGGASPLGGQAQTGLSPGPAQRFSTSDRFAKPSTDAISSDPQGDPGGRQAGWAASPSFYKIKNCPIPVHRASRWVRSAPSGQDSRSSSVLLLHPTASCRAQLGFTLFHLRTEPDVGASLLVMLRTGRPAWQTAGCRAAPAGTTGNTPPFSN